MKASMPAACMTLALWAVAGGAFGDANVVPGGSDTGQQVSPGYLESPVTTDASSALPDTTCWQYRRAAGRWKLTYIC